MVLDRILPRPEYDVAEIESWYPERDLPEGAEVTRIAPSPTGFMHIGGMYAAFISERIAHQTGGIFYLRVEDTDRKREVEGARDLIMDSLLRFNLPYDEGPYPDGELGEYGPYTQSHRQEIYHAYIRKLLEEGKAYPCFMTPEEQEQAATRQTTLKMRPGYYGSWAVWRDRSAADIMHALDDNRPFVIRFRSEGNIERRRRVEDLVRGTKGLPENDNDIVIMKADGLPTYHLAHVVDDHLMHTTAVIRGDEWLPSTTLHIQLAEALGFEPFRYGHIAPIQKMDGNSRRKLSKRKDPEANVEYYFSNGYPPEAVLEYMLNQANSHYEDWRRSNPHEPYGNFPLRIDKLPRNSGALLNLQKLDDVSRDVLAILPPGRLYEIALPWAREYDASLAAALASDADYAIRVFSIERDNGKRKDIAKLSDIRTEFGYFFDAIFEDVPLEDDARALLNRIDAADRKAIAEKFLATFDPRDPQDIWFGKVKELGSELGFTPNTKEYRRNPEAFKGSVAEVAMVLRIALTGRNRSPDLHQVMQVMGEERVGRRVGMLINDNQEDA